MNAPKICEPSLDGWTNRGRRRFASARLLFCAVAMSMVACDPHSTERRRTPVDDERIAARTKGCSLLNGLLVWQRDHGELPYSVEGSAAALRIIARHIAPDDLVLHPRDADTEGAHASRPIDWEYINLPLAELSRDRIILSTREGASRFGRRYCFNVDFSFFVADEMHHAFAAGDWIDWSRRIAFADENIYRNWRRTHPVWMQPLSMTTSTSPTGTGTMDTERFGTSMVAEYLFDDARRLRRCRWTHERVDAVIVETVSLDSRGRIAAIERVPDDWEEIWSDWTGRTEPN